MNNNNFINGTNNTPVPNQNPLPNNNNINYVPQQPQINNMQGITNNLNNVQFNNQNTVNTIPNTPVSSTTGFGQPITNEIPQQNNNINPNLQNNYSNNTINYAQQQINDVNTIPQNNNINPVYPNNIQSNNINNIPQQNIGYTNQPISNNDDTTDDELLRLFIGNNYEKITTRPFNFAGFFFTSFYMFYRKMFLYGILFFILNVVVSTFINNFIVTLLLNILVGVFVNKIYVYSAKKKIAKIKIKNQQKDTSEIKTICSKKGGTSIGCIFLGFLVEIILIIIALVILLAIGIGSIAGELFNPDNWNTTINGNINDNTIEQNDSDSNITTGDKILLEDVIIRGYSCLSDICTFTIEDLEDSKDYTYDGNNAELFKILDEYSDYIKLDIYYIQKGTEKTIVDYKLFLKENNEDISSVTTEEELRNKIGLYSVGVYTETFTLSEIGMQGAGIKDDETYTYTNYTFVDSENMEYEMKYIHSNDTLDLTENNKYNVTFEVIQDDFGYEFYIKNIE